MMCCESTENRNNYIRSGELMDSMLWRTFMDWEVLPMDSQTIKTPREQVKDILEYE